MSSSVKPQQKQHGHRKVSKPLMERRRRARINSCLAQLRALLTQAHIPQSCRRSKLEKADILEMTVRHLKFITSQNKDVTLWSLYNSGYNDCTREISSFLSLYGASTLRSVFLHPLREKLCAYMGNVDGLSFDQRQLKKWTATGLCKMGKPGTSCMGPFHAMSNSACSQDTLSQVSYVDSTCTHTVVEPVGLRPSVMKTEQSSGSDVAEVWRPW